MNMITIAPIRSEQDYEAGLARLEMLMDAEPGSSESDEFDVLSVLVERFEKDTHPIAPPTPLGAIRFRMEQGNLTARDLEPILGSRNRVSEVLSGTRPLSLDMIRALNQHLGIPAQALLGEEPTKRAPARLAKPTEQRLAQWGFLKTGESLGSLMERALMGTPSLAMLRQSQADRTNVKTEPHAMQAWCASVLIRARNSAPKGRFERAKLTGSLRRIAELSADEDGPSRVGEALSELGVTLVTLPSLPGTHLDGAAMLGADGTPIVALTLRRDQIDSFWFTLMHELAHVSKHLETSRPAILDDLDIGSSSSIEWEADRIAEEALIPVALWEAFNKGEYTSKAEVEKLAADAGVHPAIVAGRWRMANRNYQRFSKMLGHRTIRSQFPAWTNPGA
jgi:HTH-type transcriptional regulator / antitoxin HigA